MRKATQILVGKTWKIVSFRHKWLTNEKFSHIWDGGGAGGCFRTTIVSHVEAHTLIGQFRVCELK